MKYYFFPKIRNKTGISALNTSTQYVLEVLVGVTPGLREAGRNTKNEQAPRPEKVELPYSQTHTIVYVGNLTESTKKTCKTNK